MTAKIAVKLSSLKDDLEKERSGDWIPATDIDKTIRFHVRSTNYPPFIDARESEFGKLARRFGDKPIPPEETARVVGALAVEFLLLGWEGLDIEYSQNTASEVLEDESYRAFRASVYLAATKVGRHEVQFVEDLAKN